MARDKKSKINDDTPGLSLSYLVPSLPPPRGKLVVSARIYQQKVSCLPLTGGDSLSLFFFLCWKSVGNKRWKTRVEDSASLKMCWRARISRWVFELCLQMSGAASRPDKMVRKFG